MKNGTFSIQSLSECKTFAQDLARELKPKTVVALTGELGAGKTQLTQFIVEALGGTETASPSFAIHNSYRARSFNVEHFDLFRLESADDLESTGFWDGFIDSDSLVIIEWADKLREFGLESALPASWARIDLKIETPEGRREVSLKRRP